MENQIPFLKKDTIITVEIGTGFVEKLNSLYAYLIKDKSEKDIQKLKKAYESKEGIEDWMTALEPVNTLLINIYKKAEEAGLIEMKNISSVGS